MRIVGRKVTVVTTVFFKPRHFCLFFSSRLTCARGGSYRFLSEPSRDIVRSDIPCSDTRAEMTTSWEVWVKDRRPSCVAVVVDY